MVSDHAVPEAAAGFAASAGLAVALGGVAAGAAFVADCTAGIDFCSATFSCAAGLTTTCLLAGAAGLATFVVCALIADFLLFMAVAFEPDFADLIVDTLVGDLAADFTDLDCDLLGDFAVFFFA